MSELTFNFCGIYAEELSLTVNDIRRAVVPEITENVQNIPGMVGELFLGNSYGKLIFEIDVTLKANDARDRAEKLHDLANLFMTFGDGEWPMIFSNDAEYTYYGHFTNISMPQKILEGHPWVTFTLTFACSDPKGYGEYESYDITENPILITPNGTAECYPIFTCIPKKDITKIAITDEEGNYVFIGADVDPDTGDEPVDLEPLVLHDPCNTLATWTEVTKDNITFDLENGIPSGHMRSTTDSIKVALDSNGVSDFGPATNDKKWHGPVRMQWLPGAYSDFRLLVRMYNYQYYPRAHGKCEVYLLDENGERMGKIMLKDASNSKEVAAQIQIGTHSDFKEIYA
uniref:distal tail protein Dit n=1 Tax=Caenibacillus caldisaponilyticus TaxID=1674942 RepID=UPI001873D9FC